MVRLMSYLGKDKSWRDRGRYNYTLAPTHREQIEEGMKSKGHILSGKCPGINTTVSEAVAERYWHHRH